jgi:ribonuclease-3 family protein
MFELGSLDKTTAKNLNPQVLAFVGDGVYSLYVRHKFVLGSDARGKNLHDMVTNFVKAGGQSNYIERILPMFTEEELAVFKRARNHKTLSQAKNAKVVDYRRATGLEAVLGYLYLIGEETRLNELLKYSIGESNEN